MMRTRALAAPNHSRKRSKLNELLMICMIRSPVVVLKQTQLLCGPRSLFCGSGYRVSRHNETSSVNVSTVLFPLILRCPGHSGVVGANPKFPKIGQAAC